MTYIPIETLTLYQIKSSKLKLMMRHLIQLNIKFEILEKIN